MKPLLLAVSLLIMTLLASAPAAEAPRPPKPPAGVKVSGLAIELTPEQTAIFQRIAWDAVEDYKWTGIRAGRTG
jgi:hypothetical protein